ncbi:hypothetical protein CR513_57165, partial [Mucuna pruriens]
MQTNLKQRLVELLREYVDIFAWSCRDMSGLDTTIVALDSQRDPGLTTIEEDETRSGLKNQRGGRKVVECGFPGRG